MALNGQVVVCVAMTGIVQVALKGVSLRCLNGKCEAVCFDLHVSSEQVATSWNLNSGLYATSHCSVLTRVRKESLYYTAPLYAVRWW